MTPHPVLQQFHRGASKVEFAFTLAAVVLGAFVIIVLPFLSWVAG